MNILFWRRPRVQVVELHGLITSRSGGLNVRAVGGLIDGAFAAAATSGEVILDIDSPGGSPVQSDLIASLIRRRAEKHKIKVHALIQDVGASGGYWIACAGDEIHANPMSIVGSIGVIGGGFGFVGLLDRIGVERRLYTAGRNKSRLDPFSPEKPEDVAFVAELMTSLHERFKSWVRERRAGKLPDPDEAVLDGSYFLGARAQELGLIDKLGDLDSLVTRLGGEKARAKFWRPRRGGLLRLLPRLAVESILNAAEERAAFERFRPR